MQSEKWYVWISLSVFASSLVFSASFTLCGRYSFEKIGEYPVVFDKIAGNIYRKNIIQPPSKETLEKDIKPTNQPSASRSDEHIRVHLPGKNIFIEFPDTMTEEEMKQAIMHGFYSSKDVPSAP
jgi:hypothetical protein